MTFREELRNLPKRARSMVKTGLRLIAKTMMWVVTSLLTVVLGIGVTIIRAAKITYRSRDKIVGFILLNSAIVSFVLLANFLVGENSITKGVHEWFLNDYHWLTTTSVLSFILLATWNHVAPTLRTLYGKSWSRASRWIVVGVALAALAYTGIPQEDIAYRLGYVSIVSLYITVVAMIAKVLPPKVTAIEVSPYVEDNPVRHEDGPLYETQRRVVADMRHLIMSGKPSVIALTGHWGIGKTFLLLRAKREVVDKSIIWMRFEPWRYASEEALILGFYQGIGSALAGDIPGIQHIIKPLAETTDKFVRQSDGSGVLGVIMDATREFHKTSLSPEDQIQGLLEQEGRRLVVMIDDVERSFDQERIFRTLQLAHFAKSIDNVQIIFLCDKDVIMKARPPHFSSQRKDATEYLEKFIEREVTVPTPRNSELRELFALLMESHSDVHLNFENDDLPNEMLDAVGTPRGIIRLYNELATFRINLDGGNE